jgi:hypothetical protein
MAIALTFNASGVTEAQYNQVAKEVMPENELPSGMLNHIAGATPTGWRVVEVWQSQEAADQFFNDKLGAALKRAAITVQPEAFDVYKVLSA